MDGQTGPCQQTAQVVDALELAHGVEAPVEDAVAGLKLGQQSPKGLRGRLRLRGKVLRLRPLKVLSQAVQARRVLSDEQLRREVQGVERPGEGPQLRLVQLQAHHLADAELHPVNKADVYSRPNARFDGDGQLEIRASAAGNCRRALWYEATGHEVTNPKTEETLTVLEAGNALEPVVLRAMERAGWEVTPADPRDPQQVSVQVGPNMLVTGHPDATGVLPLFGGEAVVEVKTRGPEAFKRWRTLGAERSHPASVAQAGFYTLGPFGELRDAVIATMDTGSRQWDYEVIPAERVGQALERASEWLGQLGAHLVLYGPDPDALPERDYSVTDWQCKSCPFLNICLPGTAAEAEGEPEPAEDAEPVEPVTDEQARNALHEYEEIQDTIREFEDEKRWVVDKLRAWLGQQGVDKAKLQGREKTRSVGMVKSRRYSVDYRRLNNLLDPETRSEIVTENVSEYLRVS